MKTIHLISFGCPKNLVDSETMLGLLASSGYSFTKDAGAADIIIINTCGFLKSARAEAYEAIKRASEAKAKANSASKSPGRKLVVCGCLPQLEKRQLLSKFPKIDAVLGSSDFPRITSILDKLAQSEPAPDITHPPRFTHSAPVTGFTYTTASRAKLTTRIHPRHCAPIVSISKPDFIISNEPKVFSTPPSYAYIKIADGCNNRCAYCLIPSLRGGYRSRRMEHILNDTAAAVAAGRKEAILVAQDTTLYGIDIYGKPALSELLHKLSTLKGLRWIRLLYTHPAHFTDELIHTISCGQKIARYVDIPIQHTADPVLKNMGRPGPKTIFDTIAALRKQEPEITLRTTVMVGYPGETDACFKRLMDDLRQLRFDWLGAFAYSPEKGTRAYRLKGQIPEKVKRQRLAEVMKLQRGITLEKNRARVGRQFDVLIDSPLSGHTEFQAPEIDGRVLFTTRYKPGAMVKANITGVKGAYDLKASHGKG